MRSIGYFYCCCIDWYTCYWPKLKIKKLKAKNNRQNTKMNIYKHLMINDLHLERVYATKASLGHI